MVFPSVNAKTETSGPVINSSITTWSPLAPNTLSAIMERTASCACSFVSAMITPLPSARPSAFTTVGRGAVSRYASAFSISSNTSYAAVGMPYFFIRFLEKTLLPSRIAAFLSGPKQGIPIAFSASTIPRTKGSSGATTAKSMPFSFAKATPPSTSFAAISTQVASLAMPPLPGSAYSSVTCGFSLIFLMMACSLPPPPTTIIFIFRKLLSNLFLISDGTISCL